MYVAWKAKELKTFPEKGKQREAKGFILVR